jgi:serine/threonine-protein kinase
MSAENWQKIKTAFAEASVLAPGDRIDFARRQFHGDDAAFDELKKLLDSLDDAADFFEEPIFAADRSYTGQKIGNYRIDREIGRGGMGVVLLGKREGGEFEHHVAIKVLKRGIDSDEIVRRFDQERRILASLHHSNIAGLLDGGTTDTGLPYFVMEFIDGLPLIKFCAQNGVPESVKIRLFQEVCSAVSYAHTRLIVHRDLKPSNIIVTADGVPKLLDFGIAKLLGEDGGSRLTQTSNRMLTPEYASPEQVRGDAITTASDVYSLGVILYELLTGKLPYNFKTRSAEETFRLICDEDPIPMDRTTVTRIDPDLKNIVLFALRKEPERRYPTVEAFSNDIDRFTNGLPVSARRNTLKYRTQKYLKRHAAGTIASILVTLTVILGIAATLRQARIAQAEKIRSQTVSTFLQNMLDNWDPEATNLSEQDREITVKDVLDSASERLANGELSDQPEVKAELEEIIGSRYLVLGKYDQAERSLKDSVDLMTALYGENDIRTNKVMGQWASLLMSKSDLADSETVFRKVLPVLKRGLANGNVDVDEVVIRMSDFAVLRRARGDSKEAESILREVVALQPLSTFPKDKNPTAVLDGMSTLALTLSDQGRVSEALVMEHQVMAALEENGLAHTPTYGYSLTGIGGYLCQQGKFLEADDALRRAEAIYRGVFAADHLSIGDNLRIQADSLYLQGNYQAAEAKIDETLRIYRKSSGPKYINLPIAMTIKGSILAKTGRTSEAEQMLREAVSLRFDTLPENHFLVAAANMALGEFLTSRGRYDEAEKLLLKSFESLKLSQAAESPRLSLARSYLVNLYQAWDKPELARQY